MRISVISSSMWEARRASIYGSEVENFLLAEQLGILGNDVSFFAASGSEKSEYFKLYYIPKQYGVVSYQNEAYPIDKYPEVLKKSDVIIDASGTNLVAEWAYLRDKPFIVYRNGMGVDGPRIFRYHNTVVLSDIVKQVARFPVKVIPYGIDEDFYDPAKATIGSDYVLYLSRPHPNKGLDTFMEVARNMKDEHFVVSCPVITAEQMYYVSQYMGNAPENVQFIPSNADINGTVKRQLYANAKVLFVPLSPEYREAFGLVFAEALSINTPVITRAESTDTSLWNDIVMYGKTIDDFISLIKKVPDKHTFRGRDFVVSKYSKRRYANDFMSLAEEVAGGLKW